MTPDRLRRFIRFVVLGLVVLAPLPFGSVGRGAVLGIELVGGVLALAAIALAARDPRAIAVLPRPAWAACGALLALGAVQLVPVPFAIAERLNPTAALLRPVVPYLGLDHPPAVSWSIAPPETTDALLRLISYVWIGLASAMAFDTPERRRRLAVVLVGAAVFQAVYGAGEYLSGRQHIFGFPKRYYLDSATGTFINRNHMATMVALALPFALALGIGAEGHGRRSWRARLLAAGSGSALAEGLAIAAGGLLWMGLVLSQSRAGLVAAVATSGALLLSYRTARPMRWAAAVGALVLLLLLSVEMASAPGERFLTLGGEWGATGGRRAVWRDAWSLVTARPILGWGYGTFESAFPSVQSPGIRLHFDHAHNDWLEWLTEGGVVAVASASLLLGLAMRPSPAGASGLDVRLAAASRAGLGAVAFHALWDFSLRMPAIAVACAAVMGATLSGHARAEVPRAGARPFPAAAEAAGPDSSA